jgi:hypothetical protein
MGLISGNLLHSYGIDGPVEILDFYPLKMAGFSIVMLV